MIDLRLYVITDERWGSSHMEVAEAAIAGGAGTIQLREKNKPMQEIITTAYSIRRLTRQSCVALIVNDMLDVAIQVEADGVHLGKKDISLLEARKEAPANMLIGVSVTGFEEAVRADAQGADYIGAGPVFHTGSKADAAHPFGLIELERICTNVSVPVVAIGGIDLERIDQVIDCGVAGVAVISAIASAPNMVNETKKLMRMWWKHESDKSD